MAGTLSLVFAGRVKAEPTPGTAPATPVITADAGSPDVADASPPEAPRFQFPQPNYTFVDAGWDRPIRVLPAAVPNRHAIVYLHGYCGDVNAVGAFQNAAQNHGTVIALLGDQPCKDKPGRFKWSRDIRGLEQRIERALKLVNRDLHLDLETTNITLLGYSQGALRAESLARFYGKHYPRVILGGPPQRAKPSHFPNARRIAVFGGEKEDTHDMSGAAEDLLAAGREARFFLLPGVDHGDFGADGERMLGEVLDFVTAEPAPLPAALTATTQ